MWATQTLPIGYQAVGTIDIKKDRRLLIIFNIAALVLLIVFGRLFMLAIAWLRPEIEFALMGEFEISSIFDFAAFTAWILGLTIVYVVLHEAVHGVFFWLFTKNKPVFAFKWNYAYAAAPGWFIHRNPFLVTTLAPFIFISAAGLVIFAVAPESWLLPTWFAVTMNAAGAVGDLLVCAWLLFKPSRSLVQDRGDAITLFLNQ